MPLPPCDHDECGPVECKRVLSIERINELLELGARGAAELDARLKLVFTPTAEILARRVS